MPGRAYSPSPPHMMSTCRHTLAPSTPDNERSADVTALAWTVSVCSLSACPSATSDAAWRMTLLLLPVCAAGPGNAIIISIFQYLNLVLSSIGYTVAAGQSLRWVTATAGRQLLGRMCMPFRRTAAGCAAACPASRHLMFITRGGQQPFASLRHLVGLCGNDKSHYHRTVPATLLILSACLSCLTVLWCGVLLAASLLGRFAAARGLKRATTASGRWRLCLVGVSCC
jgi:hypothetical protein